MTDPEQTVDGTTVARTTDGHRLTADWSDLNDRVRLVDDDGDITHALPPGELLTWLKRGEYYLPESPDGFHDALRALRTDDPDP